MIQCSKSMAEKNEAAGAILVSYIIYAVGVGKGPRETGLMTNIPNLKHKQKHDLVA